MAINFALSAAKARVKAQARDPQRRPTPGLLRERRENELREMGVVIPLSDWLGHNNGPNLLEPTLLLERQWRAAQTRAFAPPDLETGRRWAEKAQKLGLTYREYRLELLERGRHPTEEEAQRIVEARPGRFGATK